MRSLLKATFNDWYEDRAQRMGAALAYYTIFALTPGLVILMALAGVGGNSARPGSGASDHRTDPRAHRSAGRRRHRSDDQERAEGNAGGDRDRARPDPPLSSDFE